MIRLISQKVWKKKIESISNERVEVREEKRVGVREEKRVGGTEIKWGGKEGLKKEKKMYSSLVVSSIYFNPLGPPSVLESWVRNRIRKTACGASVNAQYVKHCTT